MIDTLKTDRITLHLTPGGWMATFSGPHADSVLDLFGTRTIATAYPASTSIDVRAAIAELNPGAIVTVLPVTPA